MSQIVLSSFPQNRHQTTAQLAVQTWLSSMGPGATVNTWDKNKQANATPIPVEISNPRLRKAIAVGSIDLDKVIVEYPVVLNAEEETFTTTVILPLKGNLFIVDPHVPYLTPRTFMANNKGATVQDENLPEAVSLDDVVKLATDKEINTPADYLFVQEDGKDSWLLLLRRQHTLYTLKGLLQDVFGPYLPGSVTATLNSISESKLTQPPETLAECYVGRIEVTERIVPALTTINLINLPLLADVYRDRPLNYDGQITYDGTQTYSSQFQ